MNRRNFLRLMVGGVATAAAVRTFPFRVFSFPSQILFPARCLTVEDITNLTLERLSDDVFHVHPETLEAFRSLNPVLVSGREFRVPLRFGTVEGDEYLGLGSSVTSIKLIPNPFVEKGRLVPRLVPHVPNRNPFHPALPRQFLANPPGFKRI